MDDDPSGVQGADGHRPRGAADGRRGLIGVTVALLVLVVLAGAVVGRRDVPAERVEVVSAAATAPSAGTAESTTDTPSSTDDQVGGGPSSIDDGVTSAPGATTTDATLPVGPPGAGGPGSRPHPALAPSTTTILPTTTAPTAAPRPTMPVGDGEVRISAAADRSVLALDDRLAITVTIHNGLARDVTASAGALVSTDADFGFGRQWPWDGTAGSLAAAVDDGAVSPTSAALPLDGVDRDEDRSRLFGRAASVAVPAGQDRTALLVWEARRSTSAAGPETVHVRVDADVRYVDDGSCVGNCAFRAPDPGPVTVQDDPLRLSSRSASLAAAVAHPAVAGVLSQSDPTARVWYHAGSWIFAAENNPVTGLPSVLVTVDAATGQVVRAFVP